VPNCLDIGMARSGGSLITNLRDQKINEIN